MAAHASILAWEIPWTEESGRLQSMASQRVRHDLATQHRQPSGVENLGRFGSSCPRPLVPLNPPDRCYCPETCLIGEPVSCTADPEAPARSQLMFKKDTSLAAAFPVSLDLCSLAILLMSLYICFLGVSVRKENG